MIIYASKSFTASVSGSTVKEVNCEKCQGHFFYQLARTASASAAAPYYIGQAWAKARAEKAAARKLAAKLQLDSELVPCPHCGHIQSLMFANERKRMHRGLLLLAWVIPALGLPIIAVTAFAQSSAHPLRFQESNHNDYFSAIGICLAVSFALVALRQFLVMRLGKTGNEHLTQHILVGAPPALLPDQNPGAIGDIPLRPVPRPSPMSDAHDHQWVIFPVLRIALPPICCECLQPSTSGYRAMMGDTELTVPLCPACLKSVRRRARRGLGIAAVMGISGGALAAIIPQNMTPLGRWALGVLITVVVPLAALIFVPSMFTPPFACKTVDKERKIVRLCFRHPGYTRLLQQIVDAQQGSPQAQAVVGAT